MRYRSLCKPNFECLLRHYAVWIILLHVYERRTVKSNVSYIEVVVDPLRPLGIVGSELILIYYNTGTHRANLNDSSVGVLGLPDVQISTFEVRLVRFEDWNYKRPFRTSNVYLGSEALFLNKGIQSPNVLITFFITSRIL